VGKNGKIEKLLWVEEPWLDLFVYLLTDYISCK